MELYFLTLIKVTDEEAVDYLDYEAKAMGISEDFESLEKAVLENSGDMFDCWFHYAVIEKQTMNPNSGCCNGCPSKQIQWYKFDFKSVDEYCDNDQNIEKCEEPEWVKITHVHNWFFGSN